MWGATTPIEGSTRADHCPTRPLGTCLKPAGASRAPQPTHSPLQVELCRPACPYPPMSQGVRTKLGALCFHWPVQPHPTALWVWGKFQMHWLIAQGCPWWRSAQSFLCTLSLLHRASKGRSFPLEFRQYLFASPPLAPCSPPSPHNPFSQGISRGSQGDEQYIHEDWMEKTPC